MSQSIFVATFILRVCLILAVADGKWIDFTRDYPEGMTNGFLSAMFPLQFIIYNAVPYSTLMLLHLRNYKKTPDQEEEIKPIIYHVDDNS